MRAVFQQLIKISEILTKQSRHEVFFLVFFFFFFSFLFFFFFNISNIFIFPMIELDANYVEIRVGAGGGGR